MKNNIVMLTSQAALLLGDTMLLHRVISIKSDFFPLKFVPENVR